VGAGGASTETLTESLAVPPTPLQDKLKLLLAVKAFMVCEPDVSLVPDQSPEAVQLEPLLLQLKVTGLLYGTDEELTERLMLGADGVPTVTLTESLILFPPSPLQDRTKLLSTLKELIVSEPDAALVPVQSPEAMQLVASVVFQVSVVEPLISTVPGFAISDRVGKTGPTTEIIKASPTKPFIPVQVSMKLLSTVSAFMTSEPAVPLLPLQSPEATQLLTSLVDQFRVMLPL
jgi:hypothetical protein